MTRREEIIVQLLERYDELRTPLATHGAGATGDSRTPLLPHERTCRVLAWKRGDLPHCTCYIRSLIELERLLAVMRQERPSQFAHLQARYITCQWALRDVPARVMGPRGKLVKVTQRRRTAVYPQWVRLHKVTLGLTWLSEQWSLPHEPNMPADTFRPLKVDPVAA